MNETIKTIYSRRSMRAFKPEQLKEEDVSTIIDCGLNAPSALNSQGWHFTVVQNKGLIEKMNTRIKEVLPTPARQRYLERHNGNENFSIFYAAPTIVVVSGLKDDAYTQINCALATENMCLAAESLGIGSCIIGMATLIFNSPDVDEYIKDLSIPQGYKPMYAVSFGYKNMQMTKPARIPNKVNYIY
ncbi:MAG: nitroreductase family protein [Oligoflexales bacterium]|nr:nitroreductase family protein [Oligoflexales bacterium]